MELCKESWFLVRFSGISVERYSADLGRTIVEIGSNVVEDGKIAGKEEAMTKLCCSRSRTINLPEVKPRSGLRRRNGVNGVLFPISLRSTGRTR